MNDPYNTTLIFECLTLTFALISPTMSLMSRIMKKTCLFGFPTRSETYWAVQSKKMGGSLNIWVQEVERLYYLCIKNIGADQLHGQLHSNHAADTVQLIYAFVLAYQKAGFLIKWLK